MRNREVLVRQFRLVVLLHQKPRGLSAVELAEQLGASRATVQRDVELLKKRAGFPITTVISRALSVVHSAERQACWRLDVDWRGASFT